MGGFSIDFASIAANAAKEKAKADAAKTKAALNAAMAARANVAPTGSLLTPDAGLFGTGVFGPAPELSAAVSTAPITQAQQQAFTSKIAPIAANNRAINAQNNMMSAGGGGINYDSSTAVTMPTTTAAATPVVTDTNYMDTVNASLAALNPAGPSTREPLSADASLQEKTAYYSRQNDPEFQSILSGTAEPESYETAGARHIQTELAKGRSLGDILATGVGVGGTVNDPYIQEYQRRLGGSPARIKIPNSSTSTAAGLVGHDDSSEVYFNPGPGVDLNKIYPNLAGKGTWSIPKGGGTPGSYDIVYTPNAYDPRAGGAGLFNDVLMPAATAVMGFYNPAFAVAKVANKAAAGETLKLGDYASAIMGGLKASKILEAPVKAVAATATTPAIPADAGTGLFNNTFTYEQSIKGLNTAFAVADGDIVGGVVSQFGGDLTEKALNTVGLNKTVLDGLNINQDDLVQGMLTTEKELLKGASLDDALLKGVGKYITEGGSLGTGGNFKTPEILKKLEDVVRTVGSQIDDTILQPIKETLPVIVNAAEKIGKPIEKGLRAVNDAVVKPVVETAIDAGSAVNREVVKPVVGAVEEVGKPIERGIRAVNEAVIEPVVDTAIEAGSAVNRGVVKPVVDFIRDIDLPRLPNLPNLPNPNAPRSGRYNPNQELAYLQQFMNRPSTTQPATIPEVTEGDPYEAFDWETIFRTKEQADEYASALGVDVDADPDSVALQELSLDFARGGVVRGNDLDQLIQILEGNR